MSNNVYLQSTVVTLQPKVLEFLNTLIEKAKKEVEPILTMKRKELAGLVGKNTRTVSRYINELESKSIITTKGKRGRTGGTVIMFNPDKIQFNTSTDSAITTDDEETIQEVMERKFPKKEQPIRKRNRRTKRQMIEDNILKTEQQKEVDRLNNKVEMLAGVPNWEWFQETDEPVNNYKTYILSRMYNRYAVLFTDRHNGDVIDLGEGEQVDFIDNKYDCLPKAFYKSSRWNQFDKLRIFLEENDIDPAVYISSQFSRSLFNVECGRSKKPLPFINTFLGDSAYEIYQQYCEYQKGFSSAYASFKTIPPQFAYDFVIRLMRDAYDYAHKSVGMFNLKSNIRDFLTGFGGDEKSDALLKFYRVTSKELRDSNISLKSRDVIKKYLIMQSMTMMGGIQRMPKHILLSMETVRAMFMAIDKQGLNKEKTLEIKDRAIGALALPLEDTEEQYSKGRMFHYAHRVLSETPQVIKLILEQMGLYLSVLDINKAIKEYGVDKLPIDEYSMLDVSQIEEFVSSNTLEETKPTEDVDIESITDKRGWQLVGGKAEPDYLSELFRKEVEGK